VRVYQRERREATAGHKSLDGLGLCESAWNLAKHFFLEQVKGYVKALEKSTSPVKRLREVFEHSKESC
jgi:hypothetical protein